uniref:G-protein coupled receptors family 1 profile domain-containing protein n=1 Tax=Labrus bergylta TaxID=56723 RepID=A0A3Q3FNJ1_9LABR
MTYSNVTRMRSFSILGFPGLSPQYYGPASALLFFIYLVIALGNVFILAFVVYEKTLQKPIYLVFCHLALNDLTFGTVTLPKIISKYWFGDSIISFHGCFVQMFLVHYLGSVTSFILLVMALDRFVAICIPLRYPVLITNNIISVLCGFAWFIPVSLMVTVACGDDVKIVAVTTLCMAMFCLLLPLAFILFSYVSIIGAKKPQRLILLALFQFRCSYFLILFYSLLPPAVNPIIYCFKTQDIKQTLMKKLKTARIGVEINP